MKSNKKQYTNCYRVNEELREYLEMVFLLTRQHRRWEKTEDGELYVHINASSDQFHEIVMRARCEWAEEKCNHAVVYVTRTEYCNQAFVEALIRAKGRSGVCIFADSEDKDFPEPM